MTAEPYGAHERLIMVIRRARTLTLIDEDTANARHHRIARTYRSHLAADALVAQLNGAWQRARITSETLVRANATPSDHHTALRALLEQPQPDVPCQQAAELSGYLSTFGNTEYHTGPRDLVTILMTAREVLTSPAFPLEVSAAAQWLEFGRQPGEDELERLGVRAEVTHGMSIGYDRDSDCFIGVSAPPLSEPPAGMRIIDADPVTVRFEASHYPPERLRVWVMPTDREQIGAMASLALLAGQRRGTRSVLVVPRDMDAMVDEEYRGTVAELIARASQNADYYAKPQYEPGNPKTPAVALITGDRCADQFPELVDTLRGERPPNFRAKPGLQETHEISAVTANDPVAVTALLRELERTAGRQRRRERIGDGARGVLDAARTAGQYATGKRTIFDAVARDRDTRRLRRGGK